MNKKKLTIAFFLITEILLSNSYAKDNWTIEKAKLLGIPLIPEGKEILCKSEMRIGFNWQNGEYYKVTFGNIKHIVKKLEPTKGCLGFALNPDQNFISKNVLKRSIEDEEIIYGSREVCIKHNIFGEEPSVIGGKCVESYIKEKNN
mgnify:CR=1 FL=1